MTNQMGETLDFAAILRPGDRVMVGCGAGEPVALTRMLVEQRHRLPSVDILLGFTVVPTIRAEHTPPLHVTVFGGYGANAELIAAGADILPCHVSSLPDMVEHDVLRVDVVFVQCAPADTHGMHSLGVTADVLLAAARKARLVVAEINDQMPQTYGDTALPAGLVSHQVRTSRPLPELFAAAPAGDVAQEIASTVADLVPDRSVLQLGIGRLPEAAAAGLRGHRDLGVHSGFIGDWTLDLVESGAVTNAYKPIDPGITVGGVLMGSQRLYAWADRNSKLALREARYTHGPSVLAQLDTLVTINSAIEIDLTGQINAEMLGEQYRGAVGGGVDYIRAGSTSRHGRSIVVLASTAKHGTRSRIVSRLDNAVVTTPRTDVDLVVTEHGTAELRGQTLAERARRLAAIAAPNFREELNAEPVVR